MSPDEQGWVKCAACGCWRPPGRDGRDAVVPAGLVVDGKVVAGHRCADELLCRQLAEKGAESSR